MRPAFYSAVVVFHNSAKEKKKKKELYTVPEEEKPFNNIDSHVAWPIFDHII